MKLLKVKNFAHFLSIVWILSIIAFVGTILHGILVTKILTEQHSTVLVFIVLAGLFAFLGASFLYLIHFLFLRKKSAKEHSRGSRMAATLLITLVFLFLGAVAVMGAYNLGQADKFLEAKNTTIQATPEPTPQVKYVDSDPVVTCTSSYPNCSGQSIQARQSACSAITCCQVGNKWSVYPSENDCKVAQAAVAPTSNPQNNTQTKYPPCTINYSQLGDITYYDIPPEECASKQMGAKIHEAQRDSYDQCVKNYGAENCTAP